MRRIPFDTYRFRVITIEHDAYRFGKDLRDEERKILTSHGYRLLCQDVHLKPGKPFEDWWVHPDLVDQARADRFACSNRLWSDVIALDPDPEGAGFHVRLAAEYRAARQPEQESRHLDQAQSLDSQCLTPPQADRKLDRFRNLHAGKRCFILGNGPSLAQMNLELLKGEITFALNRISLIYPRTTWRPSYFVSITTNFFRDEWRRDILYTVKAGIPSFMNICTPTCPERCRCTEFKGELAGLNNVNFVRCEGDGVQRDQYPDSFWSDDINEKVTKWGSTLMVPVQIAAYMGIREIYLIGCDLNFGQGRDHFDRSYDSPGNPAAALNRNMTLTHELIDRVSRQRGFRIFNATPGGSLEIHERVSFSSLFPA